MSEKKKTLTTISIFAFVVAVGLLALSIVLFVKAGQNDALASQAQDSWWNGGGGNAAFNKISEYEEAAMRFRIGASFSLVGAFMVGTFGAMMLAVSKAKLKTTKSIHVAGDPAAAQSAFVQTKRCEFCGREYEAKESACPHCGGIK